MFPLGFQCDNRSGLTSPLHGAEPGDCPRCPRGPAAGSGSPAARLRRVPSAGPLRAGVGPAARASAELGAGRRGLQLSRPRLHSALPDSARHSCPHDARSLWKKRPLSASDFFFLPFYHSCNQRITSLSLARPSGETFLRRQPTERNATPAFKSCPELWFWRSG